MTDRLDEILKSIGVEFRSIEVLKASVRRERGAYVMAVSVDREGGVDTRLCEQITRFIAHRTDALSPPIGPYTIEVASAGLDRPLLAPEHFRRFAGRVARIITTLRIANRVEFWGPSVPRTTRRWRSRIATPAPSRSHTPRSNAPTSSTNPKRT